MKSGNDGRRSGRHPFPTGTRILSILLALAMVFNLMTPVTAYAEETEDDTAVEAESSDENESSEETETVTPEFWEECVPDDVDLADNDDLFSDYVDIVFYGEEEEEETAGVDDGIATASDYADDYFAEGSENLYIYNQLKADIAEVASSGGSTVFTYTFQNGAVYSWTSSAYTYDSDSREWSYDSDVLNAEYKECLSSSVDVTSIVSCLMVDAPYEFYWFDKTVGYSYSPTLSVYGDSSTGVATVSITAITYKFKVATAYQDESDTNGYTVDADKASAASVAAANALEVVEKYEDLGDYEKLLAYKDWICDAVSYNDEAADGDTDYGDPWQMIYVFDGDDSTDVVCEGYSKAFQYLCDQSEFESDLINCYTVTGYLNGGDHMWNMVRMDDGLYYLVDVTNSDTGTAGAYGGLFLAGNEDGSVDDGYYFAISYTVDGKPYSASVTYTYEDSTVEMYGETILTLASSDYAYEDTDVTGGDTDDDTDVTGGDTDDDTDVTGGDTDDDTDVTGGDTDDNTDVTDDGTNNDTDDVTVSDGTSDDTVQSLSIEDATVSVDGSDLVYNGTEKTPDVTVSLDGTQLTAGTDYTVEYSSNVNAGTAYVTVTGIGDYSGTVTATFTITQASVSGATVTLSATSYTYDGTAKTPTPTVKLTLNGSSKTLTKGTDYTVAYSGNTSAGTATVTITGKGNFTGSVKKTFTISAKSITSGTATLSSTSYKYNGKTRTPSVTLKVTVNGTKKTLTKGTDYTVTYASGRKNTGRYKVTITGKGNYKGTITKYFTILPKTMSVKSAKSSSKKKITVKWTKTGGSVSGYQIRYRVKGTSTWKTKTVSSSKSSLTLTGLKSGKTYQIQIRAYKTVSGTKYYGSWSSSKTAKVK